MVGNTSTAGLPCNKAAATIQPRTASNDGIPAMGRARTLGNVALPMPYEAGRYYRIAAAAARTIPARSWQAIRYVRFFQYPFDCRYVVPVRREPRAEHRQTQDIGSRSAECVRDKCGIVAHGFRHKHTIDDHPFDEPQ